MGDQARGQVIQQQHQQKDLDGPQRLGAQHLRAERQVAQCDHRHQCGVLQQLDEQVAGGWHHGQRRLREDHAPQGTGTPIPQRGCGFPLSARHGTDRTAHDFCTIGTGVQSQYQHGGEERAEVDAHERQGEEKPEQLDQCRSAAKHLHIGRGQPVERAWRKLARQARPHGARQSQRCGHDGDLQGQAQAFQQCRQQFVKIAHLLSRSSAPHTARWP